jgi:uncharacterized protein YkwD
MFNSNSITMSEWTRGLILVLCTLVAVVVSAGSAALAQAAPVAADWTAIGANTASGTVQGTSVSLSGTQVWNTPTSRVDGSWPYFAGAAFSPALPKSDVIQILGAPGASYTIRFGGAGVANPILHLGSLGSSLDFVDLPAGTVVTKLSSEGGFTVTGNSVSGTLSNTILASGNSDASGSIKLTGTSTFTSITFKTGPNYNGPADGILVQLLAEGGTGSPPPNGPPCADADTPITQSNLAAAEDAIACLTNVERSSAGLPPLTVDATLRGTARAHSQDMVRRGFYDHVNPDNKWECDRILAAGYPTKCYFNGTRNQCWTGRCGENIHRISGATVTPRQFVNGWMASSGHNDAILNVQFKHIGVGLAPGGPAAYPGAPVFVATQNFGSPA